MSLISKKCQYQIIVIISNNVNFLKRTRNGQFGHEMWTIHTRFVDNLVTICFSQIPIKSALKQLFHIAIINVL